VDAGGAGPVIVALFGGGLMSSSRRLSADMMMMTMKFVCRVISETTYRFQKYFTCVWNGLMVGWRLAILYFAIQPGQPVLLARLELLKLLH
jgi:hypothetical protein